MNDAMSRSLLRVGICVLCLGLIAPAAGAQTNPEDPATARHIRQLVETLSARGYLTIDRRPVGTATFMRRFYSARRFQPAWTNQKTQTT